MDMEVRMNIDDDGRRRGAESSRQRKELTPDVGPRGQASSNLWVKLLKGRRFDEHRKHRKHRKAVCADMRDTHRKHRKCL